MSDLSIFKIDSQTINIKDTTARQTAESAKTLATTASGNATTALNKINKLESEKADKTLATTSANGLMSAADKKAIDREFFRMLPKGGTYIPANADLNSIEYIKVGNYYNPTVNESATIKNIPIGDAFMMYVLSPLSGVYDNESTAPWVYRLRIFITYTGNDIFVQKLSSRATAGSFTYNPWVKMTNSKDLGKEVERTTAALNKINELEKLSRVSISYDSTKENMTITIGTHSVA